MHIQRELMHNDDAWKQDKCCWCSEPHQFWDFRANKLLYPNFQKSSSGSVGLRRDA